jgi:trehalose/maltose hydrolase-like predicted phosphorylase
MTGSRSDSIHLSISISQLYQDVVRISYGASVTWSTNTLVWRNIIRNSGAAENFPIQTEAGKIEEPVRRNWAESTRRIALEDSVLEDSELEDWRRAVETIATGFDLKSGLIEQFAGFFSLSEIDLTEYASRTTPINVVLGWERTQSSQVIKHADKAGIIVESGDSSQPLNPEASISNRICDADG